MKRNATAVAAFLFFVMFFVLQYGTLQAPGTREWLSSYMPTSSVLYTALIVATIIVLGPLLYTALTARRWLAATARKSKAQAREVAASLWRVEGNPIVGENSVRISLTHLSWPRQFILEVRPDHPDIEMFRYPEDGTVVGFDSLNQAMGGFAFDHVLCGYLRIKSISDS